MDMQGSSIGNPGIVALARTSECQSVRTALSDKDLLAGVARGDCEANRLYERYAQVVKNIANRIVKDNSEADDLAQDFFLFIRRKSTDFDGSKGNAGSWIIQMAYQRAIERRRRLSSRHFYDREDLESAASELVGKATTEDDYSPEAVFGRNGLEKIIGELSKDQQQALRLFFFEGYTLAEISVKIGQPLGNVRNHYYRALDKLRKHMFGRKVRNG